MSTPAKKEVRMETPVFANEKGCALLAAIDSGIIPETESGYDTARFDKFWSLYLRTLAQVYRASEQLHKLPDQGADHQ